MVQHEEPKDVAKDVGNRTGRNPVVVAALGSVVLAWYQYYVRGNTEHGLFIGLWPPTLLAFSNAMRIDAISARVENQTGSLVDWLTQ